MGGALTSAPSHGKTEGQSGAEDRVWTRFFNTHELFGFVGRHSVRVGEALPIMLSRKPGAAPLEGMLRFYRIGAYPFGRKLAWASPVGSVRAYPVLRSAAAVGVAWPAFVMADTSAWEPGCYTADFHAVGRDEPYYDLVQAIVRPPKPRGDMLLKLSTNTWQAYNPWGGHSLYPDGDDPDADERGALVSFDRPTPAAFFEYEGFLVRWLEEVAGQAGFSVDYAANFDVHNDPGLLDLYKLVACGSHDEYWSSEEFDAFQKRIFELGKHTIFFGANTAYWQVRYTDLNKPTAGPSCGRQMLCWKGLDDPVVTRSPGRAALLEATARYREGGRRPETMLLGVGYQSWFQGLPDGSPRYAYRVERADLPLFTDTGLKVGDELADVVGYEWDCRDPEQDGRRLWREGAAIAELPQDRIQVLFSGNPLDRRGRVGIAEAVYFESPAGARVFSAGSIRWAWGLGRAGFETPGFKRFNQNLVVQFLNSAASTRGVTEPVQ